MKLTERSAQISVIRLLHRRSFVLPNFAPHRWFECDVFEVTRAGYFREYEVKLTRADFRRDAEKMGNGWRYDGWRKVGERHKHDRLAKRDPEGPVEFYFVTPAGLLTEGERAEQTTAKTETRKLIAATHLPPHAGLIELFDLDPDGDRHTPAAWRWLAKTVVRAPRLHRRRLAKACVERARTNAYHRYVNYLLDGH